MAQRILISRTDSIGDVILTLPIAGAIKKHLPEATVIFLGRDYTRDIVDLSTNVDEFVSWDQQVQMSKRERIKWFREHKADVIIHVFPRVELARLAFKAGIKTRIGTTGRIYHYQFCNRLVPLSRKKSDLHEAQLNFPLLKPLIKNIGIPSLEKVQECFGIRPPEAPSVQVSKLIDKSKFNLILHPKSKGSARDWPLESYAELIEKLPDKKFKVFISGTRDEGELMQPFLEKYSGQVTDLTGQFSLKEFIQFINLTDGLVAASTGPLHIAAILGKKAVGIYPPIRPMHPGRWAPLGKQAAYLVLDKTCNDCRRSGPCACMAKIGADQVIDRLENNDGK